MKQLYTILATLAVSVLPSMSQQVVPSQTIPVKVPKHIERMHAPESSKAESDIYDVTMILSEDFEKFTKGTVEKPDTEVLDGFIDSELTQAPYWSAQSVYQAGGCVFIDRANDINANLCSPILELPDNGKPVVVTFKGRLGDKTYNHDWVQVYMIDVTDPNDPKTFTNDYANCYDEWKEYKFVLDKARKGTDFFFQFSGYDTSVLFDDIEIKFLDPKVTPPVASAHSDFHLKGFTANWEPVEGADSYLVSLYTINADRDKTRNYIVKDRQVDGTSYAFSDIETHEATYYYVVKAKKGNTESPESKAIKVNGLITPSDIKVTIGSSGNLEISWSEVPGADYYEFMAYRQYEAKTDETFVVSEENFDKLVSSGTPLEPEWDLPEQEELDEFTNQPGWIAQNPAHINGAYGLVGYYYQQYGSLAFLESPYMDLSPNGGNVNVSLDLYGAYVDELDICNAIVRMMTVDLENQELKTVDRKTIVDLPAEWTSHSLDLKGGTNLSTIEILSTAGYLFIDNILITQQLKAGEKAKVIYSDTKTEKNSISVPVLDILRGQDIVFRVRAVREIWDEMHFSVNEYVRGAYTGEHSYSVATSGIEGVESGSAQTKVMIENGTLFVVNPDGEAVEVFDTTGRNVASDHSGAQLVTIPLDSKGIYIVRVADKTFKVL